MASNLLYQTVRLLRALKYRSLDTLTTFYYRMVCKEFGSGSRVGWGTWLSQPYNISIGCNVAIGRDVLMGAETETAELVLQDGVNINDGVKIDFSGGVVIAQKAFLSEGVIVYSHSHGNDPRSNPVLIPKRIEAGVWIGASAIIMHGCRKVGQNSLIGAGCVVTKSIPSKGVIVGAEARLLLGRNQGSAERVLAEEGV